MNFFPYENFDIISSLEPKEVEVKLQEVVSQESGYNITLRGYSQAGLNTAFKGYVTENEFKFKPNIIYRNVFLPQIKGSIQPFNEDSRIHVTMTLYVFLSIIMSIWLVGSLIACSLLIPKLIESKPSEKEIIPFILFLFGYLFMMLGFETEGRRSKFFLINLLEV